MATDNQPRQIVFVAGATTSVDEHPVDVDKIKRIGFYSLDEFKEFKALFDELLNVLHLNDQGLYELFPGQEINQIHISYQNDGGSFQKISLTTTDGLPGDPAITEKREKLFYCDFVFISLGIAKILRKHYPQFTKTLQAYTDSFDSEDQMRKWGAAGDKRYLSQRALQWETVAIRQLLAEVFVAFDDIEKELNKEALPASEEETLAQKEKSAQEVAGALIPRILDVDDAVAPSVTEAGSTDSPTSPTPQTILEDPGNQSRFIVSRQYVFGFARRMLIDDVLAQNGFDANNLPPELRGIYEELRGIIDAELTAILAELSPADLQDFIAGGQRIEIYYILLRRLATQPGSPFFSLFIEFHQTQIETLIAEQEIERARTIGTTVTSYLETQTEQVAELAQIHEKLKQWEQKLLARFQEIDRQRVAALSTTPQATEEDDFAVSKLPEPPVVIPAFQAKVAAIATIQQLTPQEQASIPNRSGHVIWGAMAELFSEEDLRKNSIPPELFNAISKTAYDYLNELSPQELRKLAKSPSSLIRHIKNVSLRIQSDAVFSQTYGEYRQAYVTPAINRTDRIEVETLWATENLKYELFTAHNITEVLLNQSPQLRKEYRDVEHDLEVKVYTIFLSFSTEYLQLLYVNPQERLTLIVRLQKTLNADPQFLRELSEFYNELIVHFAEQQQLEEQQALVTSLKSTNHSFLQEEGTFRYVVSDVQLSDAHKLFIEQLKKNFNTDAPPILQNTANVLDALIITYGVEETNRLIQGVNPQLLEMTFGLPTGIINTTNEDSIRAILGNYALVRVFNLAPTEGAPSTAYLQVTHTALPTNASSLIKHLEPVHSVVKIVEDDGSKNTTLALNGGVKGRVEALEKVLGQKWKNLGLEERAAVYLYFDKPFDASLKQRLKSKSADLEADKRILVVFIEFAGFNDRLLPELVKNARDNGFQRLTTSLPPQTRPDTELGNMYEEIEKSKKIELELALATLQQYSDAEQELIAAEYQLTAAELILHYEAALLDRDTAGLYSLPGISEVDATGTTISSSSGSGSSNQTSRGFSYLRRKKKNKGIVGNAVDKKISGLKAKAAGKIKAQLAKSAAGKLASNLAVKAAALATGVGFVISIPFYLKEIWQNEQLRNMILGVGTFITSVFVNIIGNVAGLLAFSAISFFGGFTVPALLAGLAAGQAAAAAVPWMRWLPQSRTPPNPMGFTGGEQSSSGYSSLAEMRNGAKNASGQTTPGVSPQAATNAASGSSGAGDVYADGPRASLTGPSQISASTTTATTVSSGIFSHLAALPIGLVAPMLGISTVFISTILVITVIAGAFLVPVPTKPNSRKNIDGLGQQSTSKYVTITKTASVGSTKGEIQNKTDVPVTYTITVEPKPGYSIKITAVNDVFSGIGGQTSDLQSKLDFSKFPTEPIKDSSFTTSYTVNTGTNLVDALIMNAVTATFDVYDYTGYVIETGETYTSTATIFVGNPKVGCWPTTGNVAQLPGGSFSHSRLDAFDVSNEIGTLVYAPFPGEVCDKGTDPAPSGGYGRYASLKFNLGNGDLVLYFGHFVKGPRDLMDVDARGCKAVNAGTVIGWMDDTGYSTNSHLHYELRQNPIGVKLKDLHPDGQQIINDFNSGKRPVIMRDCF